ncbi:ribosomal protein, partial [Oryctes borbonicus]
MNVQKCILRSCSIINSTSLFRGIKYFPPPVKFPDYEIPEKPKLKYVDKVPPLPPSIRPPKMQKRLRLMRGPETVHNSLMYQQYGVMALSGGRLKYSHMEMLRLNIGRKMDPSRMFAIWRIDPPWQPLTRKGQGQRMGGGKGAIDEYVTPIKAGRIIMELAGKCEYLEVKGILEDLAKKMPFKAIAVSQDVLDRMQRKEEEDERNNLNRYTMKYLI